MENIVADISHVASTSHDEMYIFGAQPHIIRAQVCILLKPIYTWYDSFMVVIEKLLYWSRIDTASIKATHHHTLR